MEVRDSATTIFFNFNVFRLDCGKVDRISSQDKKTMREGRKNLDGQARERREDRQAFRTWKMDVQLGQ